MSNPSAGGQLFASCDANSSWYYTLEEAHDSNLPQLPDAHTARKGSSTSQAPSDKLLEDLCKSSVALSQEQQVRGQMEDRQNEVDGFCMLDTSGESESTKKDQKSDEKVYNHLLNDYFSIEEPKSSTNARADQMDGVSPQKEEKTKQLEHLVDELLRENNELRQQLHEVKFFYGYGEGQRDRKPPCDKDEIGPATNQEGQIDIENSLRVLELNQDGFSQRLAKLEDSQLDKTIYADGMRKKDGEITLLEQQIEIIQQELHIERLAKRDYDGQIEQLKRQVEKLKSELQQHQQEVQASSNEESNETFPERGEYSSHHSRRSSGCRLVSHFARRAARAARYASATRHDTTQQPTCSRSADGGRPGTANLGPSSNGRTFCTEDMVTEMLVNFNNLILTGYRATAQSLNRAVEQLNQQIAAASADPPTNEDIRRQPSRLSEPSLD